MKRIGVDGGRYGRDGLDSVDSLIANTRNNPIEELEWRFPMRTERYELRDDPAPPGKWRGGIGIVRVNRFLEDSIVTCEGERHDGDPPWGIFGGHDGLNAGLRLLGSDGSVEHWPAKFSGKTLPADSAIEITVDEGSMAVDAGATDDLRKRLRSEQGAGAKA